MNIKRILICASVLFLLTKCRNYKSDKIISPTKKYFLTTSVNRTSKEKANYADVLIHLYDSAGQLKSNFNTHAGDFNKWAVGWDKTRDTIILFSSDIGNSAYKIENGFLKTIQLTDSLNARAIDIKKESYTE